MPQTGENAYLVIKKSKSFQGPKAGPRPWPIRAHFICAISLCKVGKQVQNFWFGPPLYKKLSTAPLEPAISFHWQHLCSPLCAHKSQTYTFPVIFQYNSKQDSMVLANKQTRTVLFTLPIQ